MKKKAVIYARQSSGDEDDRSESISVQIEKCREYAKENDIEIIAEYKDENISGRTYPSGKESESFSKSDFITMDFIQKKRESKKYRDGLAGVLSHFENIDYVLCYDERRFARALANSFLDSYLSQKFIKANVELLTLQSGIINFAKDNDKMISMMKSHVEDSAVKLCRQKSMDGVKKIKADGGLIAGKTITGFERTGKQKIEQSEDAPLIEEIFKKFNAGETISAIMRWINSVDSKKRNWTHLTITRVLKNIIYCGYRLDDQGNLIEIKPLIGKAIISKVEFFKTQARLKKHIHAGKCYESKTIHPLSSLLYCGTCGGLLEVFGNRKSLCYRCKALLKRLDKGCASTFLRETTDTGKIDCHDFQALPLKESLMPLLFKSLLIHRAESKKDVDLTIQKDLLQNKLTDIAVKEKGFIQMNLDDKMSGSQLADALKILETRKGGLIKELKEINEKQNTSIDVDKFQKYFDFFEAWQMGQKNSVLKKDAKELTDTDYREMAFNTFKKIYVYKYHFHIIFKDGTSVTLERLVHKGRYFPEIKLHLDHKSKQYKYDFYVYQTSFLKAKQALKNVKHETFKPHRTIYKAGDMQMITVGENDTLARYASEGLTYLDNLPKA